MTAECRSCGKNHSAGSSPRLAVITRDLIAMLSHWPHSGLQVFCGQRIFPQDKKAMEDLAGTSCGLPSAERMQNLVGPSRVIYRAKGWDGRKRIDVLEWLSAICSHIPDSREQMVRY